MISDEEFLLFYNEYSSKNPEFEPLVSTRLNSRFEVRDRSSRTSWHAQWLSCGKNTSGWRPWYQERQVFNFPDIIVHELKLDDKNINSLIK